MRVLSQDAIEAPKSFAKGDRVCLKSDSMERRGTITTVGLLMVWVRWDRNPKRSIKHYPQDLRIVVQEGKP